MSAPSFHRIWLVPCLSCHVTSCGWSMARNEIVTFYSGHVWTTWNLCSRLHSEKQSIYVKKSDLHSMDSLTAIWSCFFWALLATVAVIVHSWRFIQSCLNRASKRAPRTRAQSNSPALEKAHDPPMACLGWVSKAPRIALWHVKSPKKSIIICNTIRRCDMVWYDNINIIEHRIWHAMWLWCHLSQHVRSDGHRTIDCWSCERMQNDT